MKKKDWFYSDDGLQRWQIREDGKLMVESVPQGESLTQQQFKEDCDVNVIMERYMRTGVMPNTVAPMIEGDFSNLPSYQEALHTIMAAEEMFMEIPAKVRLRFENDPQKLMDYLNDPANDDEAVSLGLKTRKEVPVEPQVELLKELVNNTRPKKNASSQDEA